MSDQYHYDRPTLEALLPACWVPAPGTDGRYEVSDRGEVRNAATGRVLVAPVDRAGYRRFTFVRPRRADKTLKVHRLVCEAFHGPAPEGRPVVRHLDGNPANNTPGNLAWGTVAENSEDARRHGTLYVGERVHLSRLKESQVRDIRRRYANGERISEIGDSAGIPRSTVLNIVKRKTWKDVV